MEVESISEKLSSFIVRIGNEDLPNPIVQKAKLVILDTLGCIVAASGKDKGKALTNYLSSLSGEGKTMMLGVSKRCPPEFASFANATLAHMSEFDDGHRPSGNHIACVVVPAALAVCESKQKNGTDFLMAVIMGYEIAGRIGRAVVLPRIGQCFHGTGTCGTFGAAAAAGKLLSLSKEKITNALGIAGTASAGLCEATVSGFDSKSLHAGRAAFNGVMAAYLASEGIEGPRAILEGEKGFCIAMTPEFDLDPILAELASPWEITYSGFKRHATCGISFTAVDAVLDLVEENHLSPSEITKIRVGVPSKILSDEPLADKVPTSTGEAQFSVVYAVTVALLDGQVGLKQISQERIEAPDLKRTIKLTELVHDKEAEETALANKDNPMFFHPASVELTTTDGRCLRRFRTAPIGYDPIGSPMSKDDVISKFKGLTNELLQPDQAQAIIDIVFQLEEQENLSALSMTLSS